MGPRTWLRFRGDNSKDFPASVRTNECFVLLQGTDYRQMSDTPTPCL